MRMLWMMWDACCRELIFHTNYLGSDQPSVTLNFSKGASNIIAQYYMASSIPSISCVSVVCILCCVDVYQGHPIFLLLLFIANQDNMGMPSLALRRSGDGQLTVSIFPRLHHENALCIWGVGTAMRYRSTMACCMHVCRSRLAFLDPSQTHEHLCQRLSLLCCECICVLQ